MQHVYWVIENELAGRPGPECCPWKPADLAAAGIRAIVSLAGPIRMGELRGAGIEVLPVQQPMILLETEPDRERFVEVMPLVVEFIDRHRNQGTKVLVHCHYGCDRTGAVLACYLVTRKGLSADDAVAHVRAANPNALSAEGYAEAVATYARILASRKDVR
ncbi:MAG: dual specificity protein phosphatase family protein [Planctomycetota bacterium]